MTFSYVPISDVSVHQGPINWPLHRTRGVIGTIVRLGNGRKRDDRAVENWRGAKAAGLAVSGYWFCNPKVDASGSTQMARMVAFHDELGAEYGIADFPLMMDVEPYAQEPSGGYPALTGPEYRGWLADGADTLTRADRWGRRPIIYSNAAYFGAMGMQAGPLADCPIIVARYPFYYEGAPQPPADPDQWDDWILTATSKRPQIPVGWFDWDGWQFAAGFDRVGPYYGVTSKDLDLNIIRPESWAVWTRHSPDIESFPTVVPPVLTPPASLTHQEADMPCIILGRGQVAILDAGYTTGISAKTLAASPLPRMELEDEEWDFITHASDVKRAADAQAALGVVIPPIVVPPVNVTIPALKVQLAGQVVAEAG